MPQIVMGPQQTRSIDASVSKKAYAFLEKLSGSDATPGLHIEPINGSADSRVRTGRVSDFYRAVLFKVQGQGATAHYVYLGVLPHDDAIAFAKRARLAVNPVNGIAELIMSTAVPEPSAPSVWSPPPTEPSAVVDPPPAAETSSLPPVAPVDAAVPARVTWGGLALVDLVGDLGIDAALAESALATTSEDELLALADTSPAQWQGLALIELAGGTSVAEVKAGLGIHQRDDGSDQATDDDALLTALHHPAAQLQFAFIEDDDELRRAIEDPSFAAWRIFLHPEQRKYATARYSGPFRLSGGAGTGKTVVLLHRARRLARQDPDARILLTTFTRTLADALRADLQRLDPEVKIAGKLGEPGVYVAGIDATVRAVLGTVGDLSRDVEAVLGSRSVELSRLTPESIWNDAAQSVGDAPPGLLSRNFLAAETAMVVLPARITTRDAYLTARRPGRGVALDRKRRLAVWSAIEAYRARASIDASMDFAEAAAVATAALDRASAEGGNRAVDHVLVDEGQDLGPSHWQFLRALADEHPDDLFIAEDSHQRIYGQRVVLGRYGIRIVGRSQRLRLNYRTTAQNLRYAVSVLEGGSYVDLEDAEEDSSTYRSARSGPVPRVIPCSSLTTELDTAKDVVASWLSDGATPETVGILVRNGQLASQVSRGLEDRGVAVRVVERESAVSGRPLVMTMHRAKGMEFAKVLLFGVNADSIPAHYALLGSSDADRVDALLRERSLLYVAATRARDELVITSRGTPSALAPAL